MDEQNYTFIKSRTGELVPVLGSQVLHSTIDPKREAQRIVSAIPQETGFIIILGFGGGFIPEAALELTSAYITVIDFNTSQLLKSRDYSHLLGNERFTLLTDASKEEIINHIVTHYKPALYGSIQTIPLRTRVGADKSLFDSVIEYIYEAINICSGDYTVQAHFGKRWFSNIIRNIKSAEVYENNQLTGINPATCKTAIVAAGPSLDKQLQSLADFKSDNGFIICTDTALPALNDITPDVVVSIDCQFISYYHLRYCNQCWKNIPLVLDIASPPLLCNFTGFTPVFFSGGHPLARYISNTWFSFPFLDTSGGNVTYSCLSLAEYLGIKNITIFGADFSYVNNQTYARGTYIYPYFDKRQNRLTPLESLHSAFLYRSPFLPAENEKMKNIHETQSLRYYREKFDEKAANINADIYCATRQKQLITNTLTVNNEQRTIKNKLVKKPSLTKPSGFEFLEMYKNDILALPAAQYMKNLNDKQKQILTTLLPYAAAIKKRNPLLKSGDLLEIVKEECVKDIEKIL